MELIEEFPFREELLTTESRCKGCRFEKSFACKRVHSPLDGIRQYFEVYGATIKVYLIEPEKLKKITDELYRLTLVEHRKGKYWVLTFANFHCGELSECECYPDRCWNFETVPNRHIFRCVNYWFEMIPKYRNKHTAFVVS
jgi:hypothetical protein